jgi:hypothetical protein
MATIIKSKLTTITQQKSAAEIQSMSRESYKWLLAKIAELRNPSQIPKGIATEKFRQNRKFVLGGLYHFYYDPKGKADLDYYDRFPLVLALEKYGDGFLGLNLHYLPIKYRVAFLDKLMDYAVLDAEDDPKRIRITYDILQASRRFKEFRPCIKRYLHGHIKSKILTIEPKEWEVAIFLPTQLFKGAKPQEVWQESVNEIKAV